MAEELSKGERTRAALIEVAYEQFVAQGYHGTSMRQIADAVGLTVAGIYKHFDNKENLFTAVVREKHPFSTILPALAELEGETFTELLRDAASRFIVGIENDPQILNLMFIELVEFEGRHLPALVEVFFPQMLAFARQLATAEGRLRPLAPMTLLRSFVGLLFGYYFFDRLLANTAVPPADPGNLDALVDVLLYGLLEPEVGQ